MPTITTTTYGDDKQLFNPELTAELFDKVKGHSTLAKLSASEPLPFSGIDIFTFSMDGEAAIVGEGGQKPAGEAEFGKVSIKPLKVVYQHRLTDEFIHLAAEKQLPYMNAFTDGFSKKIARAFDIMAMHGLNPATKTASPAIGDNCFDAPGIAAVTYSSAAPDENVDSAVQAIQTAGGDVSGIAMAPAFGAALAVWRRISTIRSHLIRLLRRQRILRLSVTSRVHSAGATPSRSHSRSSASVIRTARATSSATTRSCFAPKRMWAGASCCLTASCASRLPDAVPLQADRRRDRDCLRAAFSALGAARRKDAGGKAGCPEKSG